MFSREELRVSSRDLVYHLLEKLPPCNQELVAWAISDAFQGYTMTIMNGSLCSTRCALIQNPLEMGLIELKKLGVTQCMLMHGLSQIPEADLQSKRVCQGIEDDLQPSKACYRDGKLIIESCACDVCRIPDQRL